MSRDPATYGTVSPYSMLITPPDCGFGAADPGGDLVVAAVPQVLGDPGAAVTVRRSWRAGS